MAITDWPEDQRPRERLLALGPAALADAELLAIFLRVGVKGMSAVDLARALLAHFDNSLARLAAATPEELITVNGIGPAKAAQLVATLELARRGLREELKNLEGIFSPHISFSILFYTFFCSRFSSFSLQYSVLNPFTFIKISS